MNRTAKLFYVLWLFLLFSSVSAYTIDWAWDPEPRWLTGYDWGGSTFFGGIDRGDQFFGSTLLPFQYVNVEIRFDTSDTTLCARYERPGYAWVGTGLFLGSAWDVSIPGSPRRLNICFSEDVGSPIYDGWWNPDDSAHGNREYLWIMFSDYDGGSDYDNDNWGPALDVLYGAWLRVPSGRVRFESDPAVLALFHCDPSSVEPTTWSSIKRLYH
jgi:hypothetical protein